MVPDRRHSPTCSGPRYSAQRRAKSNAGASNTTRATSSGWRAAYRAARYPPMLEPASETGPPAADAFDHAELAGEREVLEIAGSQVRYLHRHAGGFQALAEIARLARRRPGSKSVEIEDACHFLAGGGGSGSPATSRRRGIPPIVISRGGRTCTSARAAWDSGRLYSVQMFYFQALNWHCVVSDVVDRIFPEKRLASEWRGCYSEQVAEIWGS